MQFGDLFESVCMGPFDTAAPADFAMLSLSPKGFRLHVQYLARAHTRCYGGGQAPRVVFDAFSHTTAG